MKKTIFYYILILCIWAQGLTCAQAQNYGVNNGATLKLTAGTTLKGQNLRNDNAGTLDAQGTVRLTGDFSQNNTATTTQGITSVLFLEGTTLQNINGTSAISLNNLTLQNNVGARLNTNLNINQNLTITTGDLNLNGKNVDMGTTAVLSENTAGNHIVKDLTATTEVSVGGYLRFTNRNISTLPADIGGSRVSLNRNTGTDYTVNIDRYHYSADNGRAIKLIYRINLNTGTMASSNLRIDYADEEIGTMLEPFDVGRWSSGTGWQNLAADASSSALNYAQKDNVTAFSHWTLYDTNVLLGTVLGSIKGTRQDETETVKIEWQTLSELNNKGFEVQVSDNAQNFKAIAFVESTGNHTTIQSYNHTIIQPYNSYYRLRQVDFNGKFTYSPVVFVEGLAGKVMVYPNPNNGNFKIISDKLDLPAYLLNAQGIEVWRGMQTEVRTTALPAGVYFLHTVVAGKAKVTKVVIEH